jgi:general secretion pathway protein D
MVKAVGGMARARAARFAGALILTAVFGTGCAARWAYQQGQAAAEKGDWDLAVARLTRALDKDHKNISYKIALENARIQASRYYYDQARKQLAANELAKAADELQIASNYDPANRSAADDLAIVRRRIQKQQDEQREREELDQVRARARALARLPVPVLSPRETAPISMRFEETSIQKIFETLGKLANVNVLFDESFRDKKTSVVLTGLSFQDALERLTMVNRLFYKVLDQNTIIIATESRPNRLKYDELLLRTFYLQNAEINETAAMIKTVAKVTTVGTNLALGAITVLGTVDQVAMAERIIDANDKARGEIVVEVQILEVNRTATRDWGLALSNYTASAALNPTGGDVASSLSIRPYLLSSLNQADWVVNIPSQILTQFLQSEDTTRILAAPRLRAAEGKKTTMKIGTEVPVPQTSIGVGIGSTQQTGLGGLYPATSFTYKTVGVTMSLLPSVSASGDIRLEIAAEFSLLGATSNLGTATNPLNIPQFLTRSVDATLRLRDGETGLIGGLVQGRNAKTFSGAIGMNDIPIIGGLLGTRHKESNDSEILISITPRIVRGPKLTEEDFVPLRVGTQEVPRVAGARPALFGPEPEGPPAGGGTPPPQGKATPRGSTAPEATARPGTSAPMTPPLIVVPPATNPTGPGVSAPMTPPPIVVAPATNPTGPGTSAPMTPGPIAVPPATNPTGPGTTAPMTPGPIAVPPATNPTGPGVTAPMTPEPIVVPPATNPTGPGTIAPLTPQSTTASSIAPTTTASPETPPAASAETTPSASVAPSAAAAPTVTLLLSPPEVSLRAGQSAGISVVLVGGRDVQSVDVTLLFDPTLVEVTDASAGSLLTLDGKPVQTERSLEPGRARLHFARATPVTGSGGVAAITFRGLRPGSGPLSVESASVGRTGGTEAPAAPAPGRLVVAP